MPAPAPSRSTQKLTLTIGILPIHLDVFSATEESSVRRALYTRAADGLHKVGLNSYDTITHENVAQHEIVRCVETVEGDLVEITDEEIQSIVSAESGTCQFLGFLSRDQFEANYSTEKAYQVRPQRPKTKVNPYEKPFDLIIKSLARRNAVALLSFVSRGRTRYAAITSDAMMYALHYDEEVREQRPLVSSDLAEAELAMGETLVDTFSLAEAPVFHDEDSERVMAFAVVKAKTLADGGEVKLPEAKAEAAAPADTDLMALLAASVNTKVA
jgi:non-homologous end joining protein Ku